MGVGEERGRRGGCGKRWGRVGEREVGVEKEERKGKRGR